MSRKTSVVLTLFVFVLAYVLAIHPVPAAQALEGPEIKIGAAVPITGHGANVGKREAIGAQAAVDVINARGGVNGVPLKSYIEDTASNPQEAVNAVRKLAGDQKVIAVVGPHYSSVG